MSLRRGTFGPTLAVLLAALVSCDSDTSVEVQDVLAVEFTDDELSTVLSLSPIPRPPADPSNRVADLPAAAHLGRFLFFDVGLSADGKTACSVCHDPAKGFADGRVVSRGIGETRRHAPSLRDVAFNRWSYWDGRADSLWAQALSPIEAPAEMGNSRVGVARHVKETPALREAFVAVFDSIDDDDRIFADIGKAIAAYERLLVSRPSSFDRFVAAIRSGDTSGVEAYPAAAQRGLDLFVGRGQCTLCHTGPMFSDEEFHNIGLDRGDRPLDVGRHDGIPVVKADRFNGMGEFSDADPKHAINDPLRYVVQKENNLGEFKTPHLRGVARTAPYMHDGRFATLREVIEFYSDLADKPAIGHREETLKPLNLTEREIDDLVAFLESLNGDPLPEELMTPPTDPRLER